MASLVVSHVAFGAEALATALGALEGPLVGVDSHMDSEILFLTEGFAASRVDTLVGLGPIVQVEVGVEPELAREGLVASSVRADVSSALVEALGGGGLAITVQGLVGLLTDVTNLVEELASCAGS